MQQKVSQRLSGLRSASRFQVSCQLSVMASASVPYSEESQFAAASRAAMLSFMSKKIGHGVLFWLLTALISPAGDAGLERIELTCVDPAATGYGTFQSHNQKVVSNRRGYFMTHIRTRNEAYTAQQWRLSRSRDGGRSFETVYEATHATNPPLLESDKADNLYLVRPDFSDGHAYLYRFLA